MFLFSVQAVNVQDISASWTTTQTGNKILIFVSSISWNNCAHTIIIITVNSCQTWLINIVHSSVPRASAIHCWFIRRGPYGHQGLLPSIVGSSAAVLMVTKGFCHPLLVHPLRFLWSPRASAIHCWFIRHGPYGHQGLLPSIVGSSAAVLMVTKGFCHPLLVHPPRFLWSPRVSAIHCWFIRRGSYGHQFNASDNRENNELSEITLIII